MSPKDSTPPIHISERTKVQMPVSFHISILVAVAAFVYVWAQVRDVLSSHEERIIRVEAQSRMQNDTLTRIDERTLEIKRQVDRRP